MSTIQIHKKSEKILLWMHRNEYTGQYLATKLNITRQAFSKKMKQDSFSDLDISIFKSLGFND